MIAPDTSRQSQLVRAARDGDEAAFGDLYRHFARFVHSLLLARLPPEDAADTLQEVFLQAWRRLRSLRDPAAFGPWLAAIARHRATDQVRSARGHDDLDENLRTPASQSSKLAAREVVAAIHKLPEAYRETLLLRLLEGYSGPEIAALTGRTPQSVRVNLHRGFKLLRQRLGEQP